MFVTCFGKHRRNINVANDRQELEKIFGRYERQN